MVTRSEMTYLAKEAKLESMAVWNRYRTWVSEKEDVVFDELQPEETAEIDCIGIMPGPPPEDATSRIKESSEEREYQIPELIEVSDPTSNTMEIEDPHLQLARAELSSPWHEIQDCGQGQLRLGCPQIGIFFQPYPSQFMKEYFDPDAAFHRLLQSLSMFKSFRKGKGEERSLDLRY